MHPQTCIPILPAGMGRRRLLHGGYGSLQHWRHWGWRYRITHDNGFFLVPYEGGYCHFFFDHSDEQYFPLHVHNSKPQSEQTELSPRRLQSGYNNYANDFSWQSNRDLTCPDHVSNLSYCDF